MPIKKDNVFMELRFFPNLLLIKKRVLIIMPRINDRENNRNKGTIKNFDKKKN